MQHLLMHFFPLEKVKRNEAGLTRQSCAQVNVRKEKNINFKHHNQT